MNMLVEPGTESVSVTATAAKEDATVEFNGVTGTGSATAEGLVVDTEYTVKVTYGGQSYTYYLVSKERQAISADRVWAVMPAPGQFVNEHSQTVTGVDGAQGWGDGWDTTLYGATPEQAGQSNYAKPGYSLGWFGGFITYEFDDPIQNSDKNKYGVDFMVYGNAFSGNSEPAGVEVSQDGETWYTLAGSKHYDADTIWNYEITYMNPNPDFDPYCSTNVPWKDNQGGGGTFTGNGYHPQPNYPVADNYLFEGNHAADIYDSAELTLSGTKIIGAGLWGYADVRPNPASDFDTPGNPYVEDTAGDGFDISWAVDENGYPVKLDSVKYVKVYNASREYGVGEISPEITAITRTTGEAESVGTTEAPAITVNGKALELTDGDYTYDIPMSGTIEISAALEGGIVWINNDNDGSYSEENVADGRIIRVLAQKDDGQPVIYYLTMVNNIADAEDIAEVEAMIGAIGEVTLAKENQIKAARAAFNAIPVSMQHLVGNYAVLAAAEAALQELKGGSGGSEDNTISVSMRLIGAELAEEDVDLGTAEIRPNYVTWIATTQYEMDKGSTVYDLFVEAMEDADLTQVGAENNYVATIYSPSSYELSEFTNGNRSGWMYTINGSHPGRGLQYQPLRDGDEVIWHYVNDYAWEVEDWSEIGGGSWPQLSTGTKNYWNGWLLAPDRVGGKGGALPEAETSGGGGGGSVADSYNAGDVESLIDKIGTVTKNSKAAITEAREAYDSLTAAQKKQVENYDELVAAEKAYAELTGETITPAENNFADTENHWAAKAINFVYDKGLMTGTTETSFAPNLATSRAMIATILYRLAGSPDVEGETSFADVADGAWYADAVCWAETNKVVSGYADGTFGPNDNITREQLASILYRYAAANGENMNATADLSSFADANTISEWSRTALAWANAEGLITGKTGNIIDAKGNATRAEIATILMRYIENTAE